MIDDELVALCIDTIALQPANATLDKSGQPVYGAHAAVTGIRCRIESRGGFSTRMFRTRDGREVAAQLMIFIPDPTVDVSPLHKITLPAPYTPTSPPILGIDYQTDEDGPHHVVVYTGS